MGHDDLFKKRKARKNIDLQRDRHKRAQNKRYLIVCEGTKTEPYYFQSLLEDIGIRWSIDDCRSQTSYPEQIFVFYLKKYFPDCINRYSDIGIEIDCFIPSINIV